MISLQAYGMEKRLPKEMEINVFRIVQELITNIVKHANATDAIVQFNNSDDKLHIVVEDNGAGFDVSATDIKPHAGMESIKNRVAYLNGTMTVDSIIGQGTTVTMEFVQPGATTAG